MRLLIICLLLTGCVVADVDYQYGVLNGRIEPVSCHGSWSSMFHDLEAGQFQVCHASADLLNGRTSAQVMTLEQLLKAAMEKAAKK